MKFLYDPPMATILVGPDKKKFLVHQPLLCNKSQYFTKALTGSFEESRTGIVILEDISPVLFQIFVTWLYHRKMIYTVSDGKSNIKQDFASLECSMRKPNHWKFDHEDPSTWPSHVLFHLYIFADRLEVKELRIDVLDALNISIDNATYSLNVSAYVYISSNTTATSPLRRFVVDQLAYDTCHNPASTIFWRALPHDVAIEVLMALGRRVPSRLCSSCYREGLSWNGVMDHSCQTQDTAPYEVDLCIYHEHADEEEKKACRARRSIK
ncbi:hypothetical protein QM012_002779 [Aureobasidium pullulans]|uniref:BTB domain-containing protein n=1 Tax=Aureobasidium pullulans TaxID=5580 RepID=A0ABR0TAI0_AURPU